MPVIRIKNCLSCGIPHEWIFEGPTLKELRTIKALTGMGAKQFAAAGDDGDPDATAALLVVLHKRDKINVSYDDVDIDFTDFEMEATEEEKRGIEELERRMQAANDAAVNDPKT
jgi:hypothetical protein